MTGDPVTAAILRDRATELRAEAAAVPIRQGGDWMLHDADERHRATLQAEAAGLDRAAQVVEATGV